MYKGVAAVPPLLMVDNILTVSKCSTTASAMNATVNAFIENKKLKLSHKKCSAIHVGKHIKANVLKLSDVWNIFQEELMISHID